MKKILLYLFMFINFIQNNILLNNSILILQIENRNDKLLKKFMNSNKLFSKNNNIKYINLNGSLFDIPPYWAKIFIMNKLINQNLYIDYFIWLDSDAFIINFNKLQNLIHKYNNYSMIITHDMPPWDIKYLGFNAGSFIIKNNINSKIIFKNWLLYYNSSKWIFNKYNNQWFTESEWAGNDYEQKSFITYIYNNSKFKKTILQLPYYYLNNNNCQNYLDETIIIHLARHHKNNSNNVNFCKNKILID